MYVYECFHKYISALARLSDGEKDEIKTDFCAGDLISAASSTKPK